MSFLLVSRHVNLTGNPDYRRRNRITYKERVQIHCLSVTAGLTIDEIARKLRLSASTVQYILTQPATPQKAVRNTPFLINTPVKNRLIDFVESSAESRRMTYGQLRQSLGLSCSDSTVRRVLFGAGYRRCIAKVKPYLSDRARRLRLQWAMDHVAWDSNDWARVIWTDESAIQCGGNQRVRVTRRRDQADLEDCQRVKFAKPAFCMVWGAITSFSRSELVVWDKKRHGNINAQGFVDHIMPVSGLLIDSDSEQY